MPVSRNLVDPNLTPVWLHINYSGIKSVQGLNVLKKAIIVDHYSKRKEKSGDSESFWRSVKKTLPDTKLKSIPTCIKADDKIITDKQSISE